MGTLLEYLLTLLGQFAGGPGPSENNLVRYGLAATMWAILLIVAWSRCRNHDQLRERWLAVGFGFALAREVLMFGHLSMRIISGVEHDIFCTIIAPLEHTLTLISIVVIAGAFLRYLLDDSALAVRYMRLGVGFSATVFAITIVWWPVVLATDGNVEFHSTWPAWLLHLLAAGFLVYAILILVRREGWMPNVIIVAFSFFLVAETLVLLNFFTDRAYRNLICPVGNSFYLWAIPIFAYVYWREQATEKLQVERSLHAYQLHLEDLVGLRTTELAESNEHLREEIGHRAQVEQDLVGRNAALAAQNAIANTISHSLDQRVVLQAALEYVMETLDMESGCIYLIEPDERAVVRHAHIDRQSDSENGAGPHDCGPCRLLSIRAMNAGKVTVIPDPDQGAESVSRQQDRKILVSTPLIAPGKVIGALTLESRHGTTISEHSMELLTAIGQQIGVAVENGRLHKELEWSAALEERQRIAAQMHDGLAQTMSLLRLKAGQTLDLIEEGNSALAAVELEGIQSAMGQAMDDVRRSISSLSEDPRPQLSLQDALRRTIADLDCADRAVETDFGSTAALYFPADQVEQVVHVAGEALANACHHADAGHIKIVLDDNRDRLRLIVEDDGCGFDPEHIAEQDDGHFGLNIMAARAVRLGGELVVESQPGRGTRVILLWLPAVEKTVRPFVSG